MRTWRSRWWWREKKRRLIQKWPLVWRKEAAKRQADEVRSVRAQLEDQLKRERVQIHDIIDRLHGVHFERNNERWRFTVDVDTRMFALGGSVSTDMQFIARELAGRVEDEVRRSRFKAGVDPLDARRQVWEVPR